MSLAVESVLSHWKTLAAIGAGVVAVWLLFRNDDIREHRGRIVLSLIVMLVAFGCGLSVAAFAGLPKGRLWVGLVFGGLALPLFLRVLDRACNEAMGGLLFDFVFNEGSFAPPPVQPQSLPNLTLLAHWRQHGMVRKAYWAARPGLRYDPQAFSHWLFVAETAALYLGRFGTAKRLVRRLCKSRRFPDYQKEYAVRNLAGWAALAGVPLDTRRLLQPNAKPSREPSPVARARRLRARGQPDAAAFCLRQALAKNPEDLTTAFQLLLVLAQDLHDFAGASALIEAVARQPFTPPAFVDYARATLAEHRNRNLDFAARSRHG
jgi:hypothetical protein